MIPFRDNDGHLAVESTGAGTFIWRLPDGHDGSGALRWQQFAVAPPLTVELLDASRPYDVAFVIDFDADKDELGIAEVSVRRRLGGPPVTASAMRGLALARWQAEAVGLAARRAQWVLDPNDPTHGSFRFTYAAGGEGSKERLAPPTSEQARAAVQPDPYAKWRRTPVDGPSRMTDDLLAEVAACYRTAVGNRDHPTNMVARVFNKPRSTAGRWVAEARARGYLEPAKEPP